MMDNTGENQGNPPPPSVKGADFLRFEQEYNEGRYTGGMDRSFNGQYCVPNTFIFDTARFSESQRFLRFKLRQKSSQFL